VADDPEKVEPRIFGAYLLLKALGRGAMGDVWLARPLNPDRGIPAPVVVKRLHGELATRKGFVSRFQHEASVAVNVESVHVAKVYDVGSVAETLYITMEYVPGWPLSKVLDAILKSGRHASIASVIDLIAGGLEGLEKLHGAKDQKGKPLGIVHRDISPKNLMVGEDGVMRLIDLGLGKSNAQDWKTRTGVVMGSVGYMPPEQARGERVDARADLYSIGVVCYEMLALRNYVKRGTLTAMMEASANPTFMKPSEFRPDVPAGLDSVLQRALAPAKEQRYQTAHQFLTALRQVIPPVQTDGGMVALLGELFGSTKREREQEIEELLALPVPDPTDAEPTKVFVMRAGVLPPDQQPTKFLPQSEPSLLPTVRADRSFRTNEPSSTLPPMMSSHHLAPPSRGVSIPVLIVAIFIAAMAGGAIAVMLTNRLNPEPQLLIEAEPAPVLEPKAEASAVPIPQPDPVKAPPPPRPKKQRPPTRTARVIEPAPPPPPRAISNESLNAELEALREQATALKNDAEDPKRKTELLKYLSDISAWKKSTNLESKQKAVASLREKLERL
jgi:serine/threonine-protein kinase